MFVSGRAADGHSCDEHLLLVRRVVAFCYEFYIQASETDASSSPEASEALGLGRRSPGRRSGDMPGIFWKHMSGIPDSPRSAQRLQTSHRFNFLLQVEYSGCPSESG